MTIEPTIQFCAGTQMQEDTDQYNQSDHMLENSIRQNNAEIERRRTNLARERISILHSSGMQQWTPEGK